MCIEDSAILSDLLLACSTRDELALAFETFNELRRDRGNFLVQTSQHIGNCYEWIADGVGEDFAKIEREINERNKLIADVDVAGMSRRAREVWGAKVAGREGAGGVVSKF